MKRLRSFVRTMPLVALVGAAALWPSSRVSAIGNPDIRPIEFGLVSLASEQTIRLSVNRAFQAPSDPVAAARRARLTFDIYAIGDVEHGPNPSAGLSTLRFLGRQTRDVSLRPGEGVSFAFTAASADTYVSVSMLGGPDTSPAIGNPDIVPTLEVVEGGRTVFTHPAFIKGFNPQPDPPGVVR